MFSDGLEYNEPAKWNYCTYKDRRFYHEIIHGVDNPDIDSFNNKLFKAIPEGCYG
jgi:hypothetical protein